MNRTNQLNFKVEKQAKSATSLGTQSVIKSEKNQISISDRNLCWWVNVIQDGWDYTSRMWQVPAADISTGDCRRHGHWSEFVVFFRHKGKRLFRCWGEQRVKCGWIKTTHLDLLPRVSEGIRVWQMDNSRWRCCRYQDNNRSEHVETWSTEHGVHDSLSSMLQFGGRATRKRVYQMQARRISITREGTIHQAYSCARMVTGHASIDNHLDGCRVPRMSGGTRDYFFPM